VREIVKCGGSDQIGSNSKMASIPKGQAVHKKKDGIITLTGDRKRVIWTPNTAPTGPPSVSIEVGSITNLQQTPATSAKIMVKIFEKGADGAEPTPYLFHFNSPTNPSEQASAIKDLLSKLIADAKANDGSVGRLDGGPAADAMALARAANKTASAQLFDDSRLKTDIMLQQGLMREDKALARVYLKARETKPASMSDTAFNTQFWSTRINVLRSYAIQSSQKKGPYNVLAQLKPDLVSSTDPNDANKMKLKMNTEQLQRIFIQHPLVKRIYNENVPPMNDYEFFSKFFLSKLYKQLRGERPSGMEEAQKIFDKYDEKDDISAFSNKALAEHMPQIINLEGNEENQGGFKGGNRKDVEMRPRGRRDVPIIATLNAVSERLLRETVPLDTSADTSLPDYDTYHEVALRDLAGATQESRIALNIKEQSRFFGNSGEKVSSTSDVFAKQQPAKVLKDTRIELEKLKSDGAGGLNLHDALGIDDDMDSDDEAEQPPHVGSRASRKQAQTQMLESIVQRRAHLYGHNMDETTPMGLPEDVAASCTLTHATTMEFLNQFWNAFLSGDPDRAAELGYLADSLNRSKERIEAAAVEADKARDAEIKKKKEEIRAYFEKTGRKRTFNFKSVRGGREAVYKLMGPVTKSLDKAVADYKRALENEGIQASTEL